MCAGIRTARTKRFVTIVASAFGPLRDGDADVPPDGDWDDEQATDGDLADSDEDVGPDGDTELEEAEPELAEPEKEGGRPLALGRRPGSCGIG